MSPFSIVRGISGVEILYTRGIHAVSLGAIADYRCEAAGLNPLEIAERIVCLLNTHGLVPVELVEPDET